MPLKGLKCQTFLILKVDPQELDKTSNIEQQPPFGDRKTATHSLKIHTKTKQDKDIEQKRRLFWLLSTCKTDPVEVSFPYYSMEWTWKWLPRLVSQNQCLKKQ